MSQIKTSDFVGLDRQNYPGSSIYLLLIGLICVLGIYSAWQLRDSRFVAPAIASAVVWLLLLRSMCASSPRWRSWTGVLQFAASWLVFPLFKAIQLAMPRSMDAGLLDADRWLFGRGLTERLLVWEHAWLSEAMSLCYLSFYFIILLPVGICAFRRHELASRGFFYGLMLMYLFGFVGYLLVPAAGPYIAFPDIFAYPPQGGALTALLVSLVASGGTGMDVFPSLHCGISLYVFGYLLLQRRYLCALLLSPLVAGLILATLYLRYHYGIDLIFGALLAFLVLAWLRHRGFSRDNNTIRMQ